MMVIMVNNHWLVVWNINEWRIFQSAMFVYQRVSFIYLYIYLIKLVVWNMFFFHSVGNVIIPTDELICFRGVGIPPTSNVMYFMASIVNSRDDFMIQ